MRGFHTVTRRNAPCRNSVGTPPELADLQKTNTTVLIARGTPATRLAGARSCVTDFFRDVFVELKALAVRCVVLWKPSVMMETTLYSYDVPQCCHLKK